MPVAMNASDLFISNALDASGRLYDLEQFREYVDHFLNREAVFYRKEAHTDLQIEFLPLFSATFPPILHSSLIVSSVMLIELELRAFAEALREQLKLPLSMSDLQGSLLERFRKYASSLAALDIQYHDGQWNDLVGIFEIRNCLVHNYGSLDRFSRRSVVEDFIRRHSLPSVHKDIVQADESISALVLRIASSFFDTIYEAASHRFPAHHDWPTRSVSRIQHAAIQEGGVRQPPDRTPQPTSD